MRAMKPEILFTQRTPPENLYIRAPHAARLNQSSYCGQASKMVAERRESVEMKGENG